MEFRNPFDWSSFCTYLTKENRYVIDEKWEGFVNKILETAKKREHILEKSKLLVRARIGSIYEEFENEDGTLRVEHWPLGTVDEKEICAPPPEKVKNGRVNPTGISYLYLSNCKDTALLEVRPRLKQEVSVGYFELQRDVKCVNVSNDNEGYIIPMGEKFELSPDVCEGQIWSRINDSFSRPVASEEDQIHYIPTQFLAEHFKVAGYDGIIYKSALTEKGYNIVLYNQSVVMFKHAKTFIIDCIKQEYSECTPSYTKKDRDSE